MQNKVLLIDGNCLIYRAYYGSFNNGGTLHNHDNIPTNALNSIGFMFLNLIKEFKPDYILVAFDYGKKTKRHDIFADYKANRSPMPADLVIQLPLIKEFLNLLKIKYLAFEGIEADDIIGTVAKHFSKNNFDTDIVSSDNDFLQLVNNHIHVVKPGLHNNYKIISLSNFKENYMEINPSQVIDLKAIMGDSSDNLSGIKGIGPKGAVTLLQKYGTLENIFDHVEELSKNLKDKIIQSKQNSLMCKQLATIDCDVNLQTLQLSELRFQPINLKPLINFLNKYDLNRLKEKITQILSENNDKISN